jgi:transcriptional regulator with XRE-family HTH domain
MVEIKIGDILKKVRNGRNQTLEDVAEILDISLDYVSKIEKGQREPSKIVTKAIKNYIDRVESSATGDQSANLALNGGNHHIDVHNGTAEPLSADIAYLVSLLDGKDREQIKEVISFAMGIK